MKTAASLPGRLARWSGGGGCFLAFLVVLPLLPAAESPDGQLTAPAPATAAAASPRTAQVETGREPNPTNAVATPSSAGIAELEKMVAAGVSKDAIKAYIENGRVVRSLTPEEMISLKEHGVPDDITLALLKRANETKLQARANAAGAVALGAAGGARLDPDSYDFWWYHYAYPRILSSTYQTLRPYPIEYYGSRAPLATFTPGLYRDARWGRPGWHRAGGPAWRVFPTAPQAPGPMSH